MDGVQMNESTDWTLNVTARGGLTVGGRAVLPAGAFAVAADTLVKDTVLTPADAGKTRVVDLMSASSEATGVHVTLPAASAFVGQSFEFVVKRDVAAPVSASSQLLPTNNAAFSLSLQDGGDILARAVAGESFSLSPDTTYGLTTAFRVFQERTPIVRTPGVFFLFRNNAIVLSSYAPIPYATLNQLYDGGAFVLPRTPLGVFVNPDCTDRLLIDTTGRTLSSPGYRVSLASSCDTVRVESVAPGMAIAECSFRYATAWS